MIRTVLRLTDALSNVLRPAPIAKTGKPCQKKEIEKTH